MVVVNGPSLEDDIMRVGITTTMGDIVIPMGVTFLAGNDDNDDHEGGAVMITALALPSPCGGVVAMERWQPPRATRQWQ